MNKVKLIFGTYNSLPFGESDSLFEDSYQNSFKPFLTALYNAPELRFTLYYSGPLLAWLERKHPEFPTVLMELMGKKSLEILGGGYWEPILPLISSSDRLGQIEMMTTYIRKLFGNRSRGCWVTEQIWEPHLASSLCSSGIDYVFLTEQAFAHAPSFHPSSPVIAEDQGKTVMVFPLMTSLAGRFLKVPPEHIIESLRKMAAEREGELVVSLLLPGAALGGEGSAKVCYDEKWLERFFESLLANRDWLETVTPGRYLRNERRPRRKIYIPGTSYGALMRWTKDLDSPASPAPSDGGAFYREFLSKYRESGLLYSKMIHIGILTNQVRGDKYRKKAAKEELWKGQAHHAYWHSSFGGIYNPRYRHQAYNALLEAEKTTRERGIFKSAVSVTDFDMDGEKEFLYHSPYYNAYIHTLGGALIELDYLPVCRNYLGGFSRYPESYHPSPTREQGYDSYSRQAFLDHILPQGLDFESFSKRNYHEEGHFPGRRYQPLDVSRDKFWVVLTNRGPVYQQENALAIQKTYTFRRNALDVGYQLTNLTPKNLSFTWGNEINLALGEHPHERGCFREGAEGVIGEPLPLDRGREKDMESWFVQDLERDVIIYFQLSQAASLWYFPVEADFRVGKKLRRSYQSTCFLPHWDLTIPPLGTKELKITLKISRGKVKNQSRE